jgi:uncharacterized membrane protein YqjE
MAPVTSAHENTNGDGLPRVPSIPLSDEAAIAQLRDQSIGSLVRDATTHVSTLVRAEIELAKSEITGEIKKGLTGSLFFVCALVIAPLGVPFLFIALAELLVWFDWPWLSRPGAYLVVAVLIFIVAGLFVLLGVRKVKKIKAPERTISSVRDTAAALTSRGEDGHKIAADRA